MTTMTSQITSLTVVYSTVYSDADQRKHQSSASLAFVWGIHWDRWISRTKGQLCGKCFHLMTSSWKWTERVSPGFPWTWQWHNSSENNWNILRNICCTTHPPMFLNTEILIPYELPPMMQPSLMLQRDHKSQRLNVKYCNGNQVSWEYVIPMRFLVAFLMTALGTPAINQAWGGKHIQNKNIVQA